MPLSRNEEIAKACRDGAREAGHAAWKAGEPYDANPHHIDRAFSERLAWAGGWRDACDEELARRRDAFNSTYEANARRRGQYDE